MVLFSAVSWIVVAVISCSAVFLGMVLFFPTCWVDRTRSVMHGVAGLWARTILFAAQPIWTCRVEGLESIEKGRHYVVVSNHQSMVDILILLAVLPLHFKFTAKKELFSIPVIGWHMGLAKYIAIDRQDPQSRKKALLMARQWLSQKVSLLFFPEGTRSLSGEIQTFKKGAFQAAKEQGVEILPVVLDGTWNAFPKRSWKIQNRACFNVWIGKPVALGKEELATEVSQKIRREMVERLKILRERRK